MCSDIDTEKHIILVMQYSSKVVAQQGFLLPHLLGTGHLLSAAGDGSKIGESIKIIWGEKGGL